MRHSRLRSQSGYTLLELAIYLMIVSAIIGSALIGIEMIRHAELRQMIQDVDEWRTAYNLFREKYDQVPGDMYNAEDYWGSDASCPNTPSNINPKGATCNGDGNGKADLSYEMYRGIQHMANAGFASQQFTGVTGPNDATNDWLPGVNCPETIREVCIAFHYYYYTTTGPDYFPGGPSHVLQPNLGTKAGGLNQHKKVFTPLEAYEVDKKIDDGLPASGNVYGRPQSTSYHTDCTTSDSPSSSRYHTDVDDEYRCGLLFFLDEMF